MTDDITRKTLRYPLIDYIRGLAVFLMIFFHLFYDLTLYKFVNIDFTHDLFWFYLPRVIVTLFLISVGMSLCLANFVKINWKKTWYRFGKLTLFALIISISTYLLYKNSWVYFGTLHCIALCSLVALPFIKRPYISLSIGLLILLLHNFSDFKIPWIVLPHKSMDYIPFFPWFGVTLIGIWLYHLKFHTILKKEISFLYLLKFLGKHAFIIYLVHQPILISLVWAASKLEP